MRVPTPVRVAIINDYELILAGTAKMLAPFNVRVQVVEVDADALPPADVEVALFDDFASVPGDRVDLASLLRNCGEMKVVVFTWDADQRSIDRALQAGAAGVVSKALPATEMVKAIEEVAAGKVVTALAHDPSSTEGAQQWLTHDLDLSPRETEVLALIAKGLSNREIGQVLFLSVNSIKTYIRTAYTKIGVHSRSQAVLWALSNGFAPPAHATSTASTGMSASEAGY